MKEKIIIYKMIILIIIVAMVLLSSLPPSLRVIPELKLYGVQKIVDKPTLCLNDFYNHNYQQKYEQWLEQNLPLRSYYLRYYSQLLYSLFKKSALDYVVIGKNGYLYEINFINSYLKLPPSLPLDRKKIEEKVKMVKVIQDYFLKNGKIFILIITPNKAALYPEYIPEKFSRANVHLAGDYENFVYYCTKYRINYIDLFTILSKYKKQQHYELFPKTGIHWNALGAAIACKEIVNTLRSMYNIKVPYFSITNIVYAQNPYGDDYDIIKLMGLFKRFYIYNHPIPIIEVKKTEKKNYIVSMQGGSFLWGICCLLTSNKIFETINNYFYVIWKQVWPSQKQQLYKNKNEIDYSTVLHSDIFILEVNQEYIYNMGSGFVEELYNIIQNNKIR